MKSFLVILKDKSKSHLEMSLLKAHVQHLQQIYSAGNLCVCGPFVYDSGAVLIIDANSQSEAEAIIQSDPFIKEKYYNGFSITEFYKANESNNWLMEHDQTLGELNK